MTMRNLVFFNKMILNFKYNKIRIRVIASTINVAGVATKERRRNQAKMRLTLKRL